MKTNFEISPELQESIEKHCFSDLAHEVGGFLTGEVRDDVTLIKGHIEAEHTGLEQTHLTFTHETWEAAFKVLESEHAGLSIVGWYHSHPDFGVFLSSYDAFIQTNFFSTKGHVALVIDPIRETVGWFEESNGKIATITKSKTLTKGEGLTKQEIVENQNGKAKKTRSTFVVATLAILILGISSLIFYNFGTNAGRTDVEGEFRPRVQDLSNQVITLQDELTALQNANDGFIYFKYTIQKGDSLWTVAQKFYGDGSRFTEFYEYNKGLKGSALFTGREIIIRMEASTK